MNTVLFLFIAVIIIETGILAGIILTKSKKEGVAIPWDKLRPLLSTAFSKIKDISEMKHFDYEDLEEFAIVTILTEIDKMDILTAEEKALFSEDLIRSVLGPRLKEIYESGKAK